MIATVTDHGLSLTMRGRRYRLGSPVPIRGVVLTPDGRYVIGSLYAGVVVWRVASDSGGTWLLPQRYEHSADHVFGDDALVVHFDDLGGAAVYACEPCAAVPSRPPHGWHPPKQAPGSRRAADEF